MSINCENSTKLYKHITIRSLITDYFNENKIDLQPEYQREIRWSYTRMNSMINTFVNGNCSHGYFLIQKDNNNIQNMYECFDGQHRLTSLKHYIYNIPFNNDYLYYKLNDEFIFYDLPENIKKKLKRKGYKNFREMTNREKDNFKDKELQFVFMSNIKCKKYLIDIEFKNLNSCQDIDEIDLIKNIEHPISILLRNKSFTRRKILHSFWKKIFKLSNITNKNEYFTPKYKTELFYILIKSLILIYRQDLNYIDITNRNIKENIIEKNKIYLIDNIDEIYNKFLDIKLYIENILKNKNLLFKYTKPELFFILLHLYNKNDVKIIEKIINNIDFEKKYTKNYSQEYKIIENMIYKFNKKNV